MLKSKRIKISCLVGIVIAVMFTESQEVNSAYFTIFENKILREDSYILLSNARDVGCNLIAICVWWFQNGINSTVIGPRLIYTIAVCERR